MVAYRETITRSTRIDTTFKRQTGGSGQYARVIMEFEPMTDEQREELENNPTNKHGTDLLFVDEIKGGSVPREFIRPTENGAREAMQGGVIAGYPVVGVVARLVDGASHEVDSSEIAFKIAGSMCLKEGRTEVWPGDYGTFNEGWKSLCPKTTQVMSWVICPHGGAQYKVWNHAVQA